MNNLLLKILWCIWGGGVLVWALPFIILGALINIMFAPAWRGFKLGYEVSDMVVVSASKKLRKAVKKEKGA